MVRKARPRIAAVALVTSISMALACAAGEVDRAAAESWAEIVLAERARGAPLPRLSAYDWRLDLEDAYAIQRALIERLLDKDAIGGYKAGFTGSATQRRFGLDGPAMGVLFGSGRLADGAEIDLADFRRLMVEMEIGFELRSPIRRRMSSIADLKTYVRAALPVIELPDLDYEELERINGPDTVATNIASRAWLVGPPFVLTDIAQTNDLEVTLFRDGEEVDRGHARNALGDQLRALLWLVNEAVGQGRPLEAGHVLITGTLGRINPALPGSYRCEWGDAAAVEFRVRAAALAGPETR